MKIDTPSKAIQPRVDYSTGPHSRNAALMGDLSSEHNDLLKDTDCTRILVVDDCPVLLPLVAEMVRKIGLHPTTAKDGIEALFHLNHCPCDIMLTDFQMPGMDGYELAEIVKRQFLSTKVIIMTGQSTDVLMDRMNASGVVDGILNKPFNLLTLKQKLHEVGRRFGQA